jgi:GNAT superfamily N-acetyltransferase
MIRIEQASPADAPTLAKLNLRVHRLHVDHAPHFFVEPTEVERQAVFAELLSRPNARAFIAYTEDHAIGYVLALIQERAASTFNPARRWLYLDQISVEVEWEGRGVGRQLMTALIDYAHSAGIYEMETDAWAFNHTAQAFFKGFGFQPKSERYWMHLDE